MKELAILILSVSLKFQMQTLKSLLFLSAKHFSSLSSRSQIPSVNPNSVIVFNFLIDYFNFSSTLALLISNRFSHVKTLHKPHAVIQFFQTLGFSDAHIGSAVARCPQVLFSDVDNVLKPKIEFFQGIGLAGNGLVQFICTNSTLLTRSLDKKLVPCIGILKKILLDDKNNEALIRVLRRCNWIASTPPETRLENNITYLKKCGIVGVQLSRLLRTQPRLFMLQESSLQKLVARAQDMGFSVDSKMFVHGLDSLSVSIEKLERKKAVFLSFGFSENECMDMFRSSPALLKTSEEKLKLGLEFFINIAKMEKIAIVGKAFCLMYSMEKRVIPRFKVWQIMKSKRLLKKERSFLVLLTFSEEVFMEKFILKFKDDAEQLLIAYKGHSLDSSSPDEL